MKNVLITGGAGFIGSHITTELVRDDRVDKIIVLDNLSTGKSENLSHINSNKLEFVHGDILDLDLIENLFTNQEISYVVHLAARGSVPKSILEPLEFMQTNTVGTMNIFKYSINHKVKRIIYASSSSVYGNDASTMKIENVRGSLLSPYAASKMSNELWAEAMFATSNTDFIGFRFFNVFGARQSPTGDYAAVIPKFVESGLLGNRPIINGDGMISRDFTHVSNVVCAISLALHKEFQETNASIYNVGTGESTTLNNLWQIICKILNIKIDPIFGPSRIGDIEHSLAELSAIQKDLNYCPSVSLTDGIEKLVDYGRKTS